MKINTKDIKISLKAKVFKSKQEHWGHGQVAPIAETALESVCVHPVPSVKYLLPPPWLNRLRNAILPVGVADCTRSVSQQLHAEILWEQCDLCDESPPTVQMASAQPNMSTPGYLLWSGWQPAERSWEFVTNNTPFTPHLTLRPFLTRGLLVAASFVR